MKRHKVNPDIIGKLTEDYILKEPSRKELLNYFSIENSGYRPNRSFEDLRLGRLLVVIWD